MDLTEVEVDENDPAPLEFGNPSSQKYLDKNSKRKGFVGIRRRGSGILAELETISENKASTDYSTHSRGNLSFNLQIPVRKKSDRLCQSFTHSSNIYSSHDSGFITDTLHQQPSPSKLPDSQRTPPAILRQRIKDANEIRSYLEKELNELKEFTTTEKQILSVEKGFESLQEENSNLKMELDCLQVQNMNLKLELEEVNKLANSQKDLIAELKNNYDEVTLELTNLQHQKNILTTELDKMKATLLDEEVKLELAESKWTKREEELKKSLEESWSLLKVKDSRLNKIKENIDFLYSEREIMSKYSLGESTVPCMFDEKIKAFDAKVNELFNLTISENDVSSDIHDNLCSGDSTENKGMFDITAMCNDLKKYKEDLNNLNIKIKEQEVIMDNYSTALCGLENSLEYHSKSLSREFETTSFSALCKQEHNTVFEKINCELSLLKHKSEQVLNISMELKTAESPDNEKQMINSSYETSEQLKTYEEKIKMLEAEICDYKAQISKERNEIAQLSCMEITGDNSCLIKSDGNKIQDELLLETLINNINVNHGRDLACSNCCTTEKIKDASCVEIACQTDISEESSEQIFEKGLSDTYLNEKDHAACQTDDDYINSKLDSIALSPWSLEASSTVADENEPHSIEKINAQCQTHFNLLSIQEFEDKINILESIIGKNNKLEEKTFMDRSMQNSNEQVNASSQTQLNFMSINDYENEISNLKFIITNNPNSLDLNCVNRSMQHSTEQEHTSSQTLFDFISQKEYEDKIFDLETFISDKLKMTEQINASSQTQFSLGPVDEYEERINDLEALVARNSPIPTSETKSQCLVEYVDCSSQTLSDSIMEGSYSKQSNINGETSLIEMDKTLSDCDSVLSRTLNKSDLHRSGIGMNSVLGEFIEFSAPETSTFDFTLNGQLEHSILKSKLKPGDMSVTECNDPLGFPSEESVSSSTAVPLPYRIISNHELTILKEQYKNLNDQLDRNVEKNNKSIALINEIEKLLFYENIDYQADMIFKLKRIIQAIKEFEEMPQFENMKHLGLLAYLKNLIDQNSELNDHKISWEQNLNKVDESLLNIKLLKTDFYQLQNSFQTLQLVSTDFSYMNSQLQNLYTNFNANNIATNELKENLNNLMKENYNLKDELSNLKLLNNDLKATSQLYENLLLKHSELQSILNEKETQIKENNKFKNALQSFVETIKEFSLICRDKNSGEFVDKNCFYENSLSNVVNILQDYQKASNLLQGINEFSDTAFCNSVENICQKKLSLEQSNETLKSNLMLLQEKLFSLTTGCNDIRNSFELSSNEFMDMKSSFGKILLSLNEEVENVFKIMENNLQQINSENEKLKSQVQNLESLLSVNDKYSELLNSYKAMEAEFNQCKSNCSEYQKSNESLKSNISEMDKNNCCLKEKVASFESEIFTLKEESKILKTRIKELEPLSVINEKYLQLIKSYETLEKELSDKKEDLENCVHEYESLKEEKCMIEQDCSLLKELIDKFEEETLIYKNQITELENVVLENKELTGRVASLEEVHSEYLVLVEKHKELEEELMETRSASEDNFQSLTSSIAELKNENSNLQETISTYKMELQDYQLKFSTLEKVELEHVNLQKELDECKSMMSVNDKYLELLSLHESLEVEHSKCNQNYLELLNINANLKSQNDELKQTMESLNNQISKYESGMSALNKTLECVESKYAEMEKELNEKFENEWKDSQSLVHSLKEDKALFVKMFEHLPALMTSITCPDEMFVDLTCNDSNEELKEIFAKLKTFISYFIDLKEKLNVLDGSLIRVNEENAQLVKRIELMNEEIKHSKDNEQSLEDKLTRLLDEEKERCKLLNEEIAKWNKDIGNILITLNYPEEPIMNDKSLLFLRDTLTSYQSNLRDCEENSTSDLTKKICILESQLHDTDSFKRKFSKELHGLKPDLNVSDLMKLSLEDLQITMISTIMEKESAVVANLERDYEIKLALSSDKINQLEEEEKRRITWIREIESENDRILNECKQIHLENQSLKSDIVKKSEKIEELEKEIKERKAKLVESLMQDEENEKHEQEQLEKEKAYFESSVHAVTDITKRLEEKNKECEEALATLQCKSETIYQLEKLISDSRTEKAHLEEELKCLKEKATCQCNSFEEYTKKMECEINSYKEEMCRLNNIISITEDNHMKEKLDLQHEINSKVFLIEQIEKLGKEADIVVKHNIGRMLDNHVEKVDKLNIKIKELSCQLSSQNLKFTNYKTQNDYIDNLKSEIDCLKSAITVLEMETNNKPTVSVDELSALKSENNCLKIELDKLKKELVTIQVERNAFFQDSLDNHKLKEEISRLNDCLQELQNELEDTINKNKELESCCIALKNINTNYEDMKELYEKCQEELMKTKQENSLLQERFLEHDQSNIKCQNDILQKYQEDLDSLRKEKESLLSSYTVQIQGLKDEISLLKGRLQSSESEVSRLCDEKDSLKKEFFENLKFEKDLRNSAKMELTKRENELLNLKREKDLLIIEINKIKQTEQTEISHFSTLLQETNAKNEELKNELLRLNTVVEEKSSCLTNLEHQIEEMNLTYHSEESCPYRKDLEECRVKINDFDQILAHERDTFKLWKNNFEEDMRCRVLLIGDLESKLKKETQNYKEAMMSVAELQHKLFELEDKLKKSEDKIKMQREVFIREKSKLELEIKNKDKYEFKLGELKKKSEELAESINIFLDKIGALLKKEVQDLGSAFHEVCLIHESLVEEQEKVKQLDEECEELNGNIKYLENELGKLYISEDAENKKINEELEKLKEEENKNEQLTKQLFEAQIQVNSLKNELENLQMQISKRENENKSFEQNVKNLLEENQKLNHQIINLEKSFLDLSTLNEQLQNKEKNLMEDILKLNLQISGLEKTVVDLKTSNEQLQKKENNRTEELIKENKYLKLQMVNKNTKISKLEMRLESDSLPFQRRAEAAEQKVEELSKELKTLKLSLNSRETAVVTSSPRLNPMMEPTPSRIDSDNAHMIATLQEENKKLQKEKKSLKQLALLRHKEIKELTEKLQRFERRHEGNDNVT